MSKEFTLNKRNVILNFSKRYCSNPNELLDSKGFIKVLRQYIKVLDKQDSLLLDRLHDVFDSDDLKLEFLQLFKLLILMDKTEIIQVNKSYKKTFKHTDDLIEFIEGLYNYWRALERYAVIETTETEHSVQTANFIEDKNHFTNLILKVYRRIEENLLEHEHNVYRQLSAGINAGVVLTKNATTLPTRYDKVEDIPLIKKIVFTPPFIIYPSQNTRSGLFHEVKEHPLDYLDINPDDFLCYPAKVGSSLTFIYFHKEYMNHGLSLCNLFDLAEPKEYKDRTPDLIYIFGAKEEHSGKKTVYYRDNDNNILVGYVAHDKSIDYFGYMKKMILTLHNLRMLDLGHLPIHGAMVNITLKNGLQKNIAIIGDSGAGKSESLEAFRTLSKKYLKEIKIIFDDMGSFHIEGNKVVGYGTEVGAFVRLDDLEMGYSFMQMDRAIFMNPHRINARLLLPVSTFETITKGYPVDILLYANNYDETNDVLQFFDTKQDAIDIFVKGKRKAKGTTSESGIVESFFANPFGPVQEQDKTMEILHKVFSTLYDHNVPVGQIYTKLAIPHFEQKGPEEAAKHLFKWLKK